MQIVYYFALIYLFLHLFSVFLSFNSFLFKLLTKSKSSCSPYFFFFLATQMDGLVRVNGEVMEDVSVSTPVSSSPEGPQETTDPPPAEKEDLATAQPATKEETGKRTPPPQTDEKAAPSRRENLTTFSGSAISSLLGGRNCITTTTIVTELTQTRVEPHYPPLQGSGQVISCQMKRNIVTKYE